ncbi:PH domain-containing protein [uncultured Ruminococcus sp.]|uniref:PH domain-containing protein n=1 Tax=uncultured Ruminococcus sp. TaxID=165186 RepID=UPI0025F4E464|nr:PH domain-containing protein [uncultured Ruminococcus sp.]
MKIYKLSKRPLILIYVFLAAILLLIRFALNLILDLIDRFVPNYHGFADYYVLLPLWVIAALFAVLVLPFYFHKACYTVSNKEITAKSGLIITSKQFMLTSAVKSVTSILLPLGRITGMNFVILNALGSRLVIPFMNKRDAEEIVEVVNNSIRSRRRE